MQLILVQKPTVEIITLNEVKNYLRIDNDYDDILLEMLIKSTREAMEAIIQKSVMTQIWKYEVNIDNFAELYNNKMSLPRISDGCIKIPLPKPPVVKIISLTSNEKEISKEYYNLEKDGAKFFLSFAFKKAIEKKSMFPLAITYETGIANDIKHIPYQLKLANLMLVTNAYQERYSYNNDTIISQNVKQLLTPFLNLRIF